MNIRTHTSRVSRARSAIALLSLAALLALVAALPGAALAGGSIVFDGSPGTAAPPMTLGPYEMTPFPADGRPLSNNVTHVPGPTGDLGFDRDMRHYRVAQGWATWSHGYTGDVYFSNYDTAVVMTLPPGTRAFYFYAEPNVLSTFNVTATADDGTTSGPIPVTGSGGAKYFGFYSTGPALASIEVDVDLGSMGFAVGEFGIAVLPVGGYTETPGRLALIWPWLALVGLVSSAAVAPLMLRRRTA